MSKKKGKFSTLLGHLYFQVVVCVLLGIILGLVKPDWGEAMKPVGDGFIKLIKMLLAPIIFGTIVVGIAKMGNLKEVGRVGVKALIYFEIVSTLALVIGLIVVNVFQPGVGMNIDPANLDAKAIASYTSAAKQQNAVGFFMDIIPASVGDAFVKGNMLQIILFALLFGLAVALLHDRSKKEMVINVIDSLLHGLFGIVSMVMRLAPLGAFGAMAFTVGKYGLGTLMSLGKLILCVYITSIAFVFILLGAIAWMTRISLWKFLKFIREEIVITFATCSTEAVLPRMMAKLEHLGCSKPVVGLVLPTGYTFNADGTAIYMTMAAIFIAQAMNIQLTIWDQMLVLGVLLFTSKGSAGVAGAGFVTLAATLASMDSIPVAGMVLLLGVDRFINEARAVTNLIGNGIATVAVAKWEGAFDAKRAADVLDGRIKTDDLALEK
jgi:DAACS family dicarboxylate/amino acid:cation (Na+ or H+) symporter/aerobic C4-dicarboxylate transport protein